MNKHMWEDKVNAAGRMQHARNQMKVTKYGRWQDVGGGGGEIGEMADRVPIKLFLQSSELIPPAPSSAGECVPTPTPFGSGVGEHTGLRERGRGEAPKNWTRGQTPWYSSSCGVGYTLAFWGGGGGPNSDERTDIVVL